MTTTITIVRKTNGIETTEKIEADTKALAKVLAKTFNEEQAYFIDDNNEAYAYI